MNTGSVLAQFTITLSKAVTEPVSVEWFTSDGTAKAGVDYAANKGIALFAPGETEKKVDILIYGRAVGTEDRSFFVEMLPPTNAILGAAIGECIIHVDTTGSEPVTQIIVPTGPQGLTGKSAYQSWLDTGHSGSESEFLEWLKPSPEEIAQEVAPLLDVGNTTLTAEGTEGLSKPDATTVKAVARRVAYVAAAKIATVTLSSGDNVVALTDMAGPAVDFSSPGFYPRVLRGSVMISPWWAVQPDGRLLIKDAQAGDVLYACQYDAVSGQNLNENSRELWRRTLADAGLNLVDGSFERGAVLQNNNDVVWHAGGAQCYRWLGTLPKTVTAGTAPGQGGGISAIGWESIKVESVYSWAKPLQYRKVSGKSFESGGKAEANKTALLYKAEGLYYVPKTGVISVPAGSVPDSNWRCVGMLNGYPIYDVRNWGLVGDDFTDNTAAFATMLSKQTDYNGELYFPSGTYRYSDIGAVTLSRFTFRGDGSMRSKLRCTNTTPGHTALDINAWPDPVNPNQQFIDSFNLIGLHVEGNSNTLKVVRMQGCSRCKWSDVTIWGARSTDGVGLSIEACSINQFDSIYVSKYRNLVGQTTNVPFYGLVITTGYRAGAFQASSTDNVFTSCGWEGVTRGCLLTYADGTLMLAGTSEANLEYDLAIQVGCRFNSFINFAMESVAATFNAQDRGEYSYFKNCYSNKLFYIGQNSRSSEISGGYYQQITTQTGSSDARVHDLTVGNWGATVGDGVDITTGVGHVAYSIYNKSIPDYINTTDIRQSITFSQSSVSGGIVGTWDNNTRLPVTVYVGGTANITAASIIRGGAGGDAVSIPTASVQQVHLEAKDRLSITWSTSGSAPVCSYRRKRGYN